jgi:hypothetical protein
MDASIPAQGHGSQNAPEGVPEELRPSLIPIARRVFWWGEPEAWLNDINRFAAQVMTYGDWNDTMKTLDLLGDSVFLQTLKAAPPGVFDIKSWTYWHVRYGLEVPALPSRRL